MVEFTALENLKRSNTVIQKKYNEAGGAYSSRKHNYVHPVKKLIPQGDYLPQGKNV